MDLYGILKDGLNGEGSNKMWCITKILSDCIDEYVPEDKREAMLEKVYYGVNGGHFNRDFAEGAMLGIYYTDEDGIEHSAPYWSEDEMRRVYESVKDRIPDYNFYDFEVTMNMAKADNCNKLRRWFPGASEMDMLEKITEEALNYLKDEDNPYGTEKIWRYMNPMDEGCK